MSNLITKTKIILPSRRSDLLSRPRLSDQLYDALMDHQITIVAAPAGYGKTSLAVDLAHQSELPVCWYTLDRMDQDLQRFIAHFVASIAHQFPQFGQQSTAALRNIEQNDIHLNRLVTTIVNDLYDHVREHFALVLDDYHLVGENQEISDFINRFIQFVGENCHLVLLSRKLVALTDLPLMVARSQVGGLDYTELAFRPEEIQALVLQNHHLTLSDTKAKAMVEETEGWITGLLLSTQTLGQEINERAPAARVSDIELYSYLAQQVLDQQPETVREFLLRTSLLEEFNADLCAQVFGDEQDWEELIDIAKRDNLFILPVGAGKSWVRYHHLFQDFLQTRLAQEQPNAPDQIQRRFAAVLTEREEWERAYEVYARLDDMDAMADLIEQARAPLMRVGRWKTLADWLDALPDEIRSSRPGLVSARGIIAVMLGQVERGLALLNQAMKTLRNSGNTHDLAYTLERRAYARLFSGDYQAALSDAEEALSLASEEEELKIVRGEALKVKASCWKHLGRVDTALKNLKEAIDVFSDLNFHDDLAIVNTELGEVYKAFGSYKNAMEAYQEAIDHCRKTGNILSLSLLLNNAGVVYHATGEYKQTSQYLDEALIHAQKSGYKYAEAYTLASIGDVYADLDAPDAAREAYLDARQIAERINNRFLLIYLDLAEASWQLQRGIWQKRVNSCGQHSASRMKAHPRMSMRWSN